jgi:uncharacterized phage protein gp47/JayE
MAATSPTAFTITADGFSAPSFAQIVAYYTGVYQSIYGSDVYLGSDSQDGQLIAAFSQGVSDFNAAAEALYNSFSPATAQGVGLASVVKINGLQKLVPSYSTVQITIVGVAKTVISNGVAKDTSQQLWNLPVSVTIPDSGTITVIATAQTVGAITAATGTITSINTPVFGWQSVTNPQAAIAGSLVETDAALRNRQSASTALPSVTIFEGIEAAIKNIVGVTRAKGYENNTATVDALGVAANSLEFVVEGGAQSDIMNAIFEKYTPGIPLAGNVSQDMMTPSGSTRTIKYQTATGATITVALTIKALAGWSTATEPLIAKAVADYINALPIGQNVSYTALLIPAYLGGTSYFGTFNITAMTVAKNGGSPAAADAAIAFTEAPQAAASGVTFTMA